MAIHVSLHHMSGGVGSTTLACQLARWARHDGDEVVIDAKGEDQRHVRALLGASPRSQDKELQPGLWLTSSFSAPDGATVIEDNPVGHGLEVSPLADVRVLVVTNAFPPLLSALRDIQAADPLWTYDLVVVRLLVEHTRFARDDLRARFHPLPVHFVATLSVTANDIDAAALGEVRSSVVGGLWAVLADGGRTKENDR